jgi:hypothetical protein
MSKPFALVLVTPTMRDYRRSGRKNPDYPHLVYIAYKDLLIPWQIPWAFRGLHPLNLNRIRASGGVQVRAIRITYWGNDWMGRLAKFLFGWIY